MERVDDKEIDDFSYIANKYPVIGIENPRLADAAEQFVEIKSLIDRMLENDMGRAVMSKALRDELNYYWVKLELESYA